AVVTIPCNRDRHRAIAYSARATRCPSATDRPSSQAPELLVQARYHPRLCRHVAELPEIPRPSATSRDRLAHANSGRPAQAHPHPPRRNGTSAPPIPQPHRENSRLCSADPPVPCVFVSLHARRLKAELH